MNDKLQICAVLACLASPSFAHAVERAARLDLHPEGLRKIANQLEQTYLRDVNKETLPDYEDEVDHGVKVKVQDIEYSVKFRNLTLQPRNGYLNVKVGVHDVKVTANRLKLKKSILGGSLRSTCKKTAVKMGYDGDLPFEARMKLSVVKKHVKVNVERVKFKVDGDNYDIDGPSECSGDIGIGQLVKSLVRSILERSRDRIEETVSKQVRSLGPKFASALDDQTSLEMVYRVNLPPLPKVPLAMRTWPSSFNLSTSRLRFELGATVTEAVAKHPAEARRRRKAILGSFGVNPQIFNEALTALVGEGIDPVAIDVNAVPGIDELLNVEQASSIWPDLLSAPTTDKKLKMAFGLPEAPRFYVDETKPRLHFHIPRLTLNFDAPLENVWKPYFNMELSLHAELRLREEKDLLMLEFATPPTLLVAGDWAEDYEPSTPLFEQDLAESILSSVFEYLYASGPLWQGKLVFPDGHGGRIQLSNPQVERLFIQLELHQ